MKPRNSLFGGVPHQRRGGYLKKGVAFMKYVLVIGDGMADDPITELGGKTPLHFASTPAMDAAASCGVIGNVLTIPQGLPAGSDTAILSIFGCDPRVCYSGRAPLEAAATGISLSSGDIAYRCNMVSYEDGNMPLDNKKLLSHSAGSIEGELSAKLVGELFDTPIFREAAAVAGMSIYPAQSFRHIAVQKAASIEGIVLIPPHDNLGRKVGELLPSGCDNAVVLERLMRVAHDVLDEHPINAKRRLEGKLPANGIWFWAEGTAIELPSFMEKYSKSGSVISAVPLCQGIGALMGLRIIHVDGATGLLETNYEGKVDAAVNVLKTDDFVAIHIEAPDECSHDGDLGAKLQAIERIDSRIIAPLVERLKKSGDDFRMLVISDHRTLISTRGHDGGPVPYLIFDSRHDNGAKVGYCENDAETGLVIAAGTELMGTLFEDSI